MQGLEKSREFFRQKGLPMLEEKFPELLPLLAAGRAGRGSECFGFDDEISEDHDFVCGFTFWLADEDEKRYGFRLQRAYDALIREAGGEKSRESKLGYSDLGVVTIEDFYRRHTGIPGAPRTWQEWLYTPEYAFAESTNGEVFMDNAGLFTAVRSCILYDMPEDVRLKKIAARLMAMAQNGQYNFERCHKHNEPGAAAMALCEFVKNTISLIFLLNFKFAPYSKWQFRALRELSLMGELEKDLVFLMTREAAPEKKSELIEMICARILDHLKENSLTGRSETYLEPHAFEVMKKIRSSQLRSLHVMEG